MAVAGAEKESVGETVADAGAVVEGTDDMMLEAETADDALSVGETEAAALLDDVIIALKDKVDDPVNVATASDVPDLDGVNETCDEGETRRLLVITADSDIDPDNVDEGRMDPEIPPVTDCVTVTVADELTRIVGDDTCDGRADADSELVNDATEREPVAEEHPDADDDLMLEPLFAAVDEDEELPLSETETEALGVTVKAADVVTVTDRKELKDETSETVGVAVRVASPVSDELYVTDAVPVDVADNDAVPEMEATALNVPDCVPVALLEKVTREVIEDDPV